MLRSLLKGEFDLLSKACTIAVVIPAYQAESSIQQVVREFSPLATVVLVVDDGSTDGTALRVEELKDPKVELLKHPRNRGVGAAMKTGFAAAIDAKVDLVIKADADGQMKAAWVEKLVAPLVENRADVAKGNRWYFRKALSRMPRLRRWGNLALSFLTRVASGQWDVFDPNNGYIAWRRELLERIDLESIPDGYTFESGMLIETGILGAVVQDVPIPAHYESEQSHLKLRKAFFQFLFFLSRNVVHRVWRQYFVTDFNAVSLLLVAGIFLLGFGGIFGGFHWWESYRLGVPATAGTVIVAALPVLLGFNCLLQAMMIDVTRRPPGKLCSDL